MGYTTASTEWPVTGVPDAVKSLLDRFFLTMDTNAPESGDRLADEIFAANGILDGHHRAEGTDEIRRSRDHAWKVIETRRHELLKVYTDSQEGDDLLIIGQVTVGLRTGERKRGELIARTRIDGAHTSSPKLMLYKVWMDASAMETLDAEN